MYMLSRDIVVCLPFLLGWDGDFTRPPPIAADFLYLFSLRFLATLWNFGSITKEKILNRAIFLETIAAIPGMVAAIIRVSPSRPHVHRVFLCTL